MAREQDPRRLKELLADLGARLGPGALESGVIWGRWTDIVGSQIATQAEPTSLRRGVLRVRASSPTWATEIGYLAEQIKAAANEVVGKAVVSEVRVWTGPGPIGRPSGSGSTPAERRGTGVERPAHSDPHEALEAARAAQERRRAKGAREP